MIHKFEAVRKDSCLRDNVYVLIDEAHRSVAKDLGIYLMAAVSKATIIGFTGTPIAHTSQGESTFKIFGTQDALGYLDKYSIAESIADRTTLPIKYMMALSEMTVPAERLDKEFFALAESQGVSDVEELNKVLDRAVGLRTFLTADDRIEGVGFHRGTLQGECAAAGLQGLRGCGEPRGVRQVQEGTGHTATARVDRSGLHRERR